MDKVSVNDVRNAVATHNVKRWRLRSCSICDEPLHYLFYEGDVFYQSGCECSWSPPQISSHASVAETLNMQSPDIRARMWAELIGSGSSPVTLTEDER